MIYQPPQDEPLDPARLVTACIESGSESLLLDEGNLTAAFFDLKSGVAGELLHRLSVYRLRLAAVIPDATMYGDRFDEFVREANQGKQYRFFRTASDARAWLEDDR